MLWDVVRIWFNKTKKSGCAWQVIMWAYVDERRFITEAYRETRSFWTIEEAQAFTKTLTYKEFREPKERSKKSQRMISKDAKLLRTAPRGATPKDEGVLTQASRGNAFSLS